MFSYFKDRREQFALLDGFKEAAAVSSWTLITLIELNANYFADNKNEEDEAQSRLSRGLSYSEEENHRAAYLLFMSYIDRALTINEDLVLAHPSLVEAVVRIRTIQKSVLQPLWEKHQDKLVKK